MKRRLCGSRYHYHGTIDNENINFLLLDREPVQETTLTSSLIPDLVSSELFHDPTREN